ncbi:glycoside hydrolase domain-containing protein [Paenibacillus larvae]
MSKEVLDAQVWLNSTYGKDSRYIRVKETGYPGTATSKALISALQIELGLSSVTGNFGNMTSKACDVNPLDTGSTGNKVKLLQYGLYCKGYNPRNTDGVFNQHTQNALKSIQQDAGLSENQISTAAKGLQMKAVLGPDEYKKVSRGDSKIREMQQELNRRYLDYTGLRPCDGIYSRGTNAALIYALQAEEHLPTSVANGNFGVTTRKCCPEIPYTQAQKDYHGKAYNSESITRFIKLVQFTLYCVGHDRYSALPFNGSKYDPGKFNGEFNNSTREALHKFQRDAALPVRDRIGIDEWMALLVSTGNPDRAGDVCDCASRITPAIAAQLKEAKYKLVGRYLTGDIVVKNTRVAKNLLRPEMEVIFKAKLRLFVIFQDARQYYTENPDEENIVNYFTQKRGYADAEKAFSAAKSLGVPRNEIIYFTVDYDFMEDQVKSKIIPYFKGINEYAKEARNIFRIGIYGSRNTCSLVKNEGYSVSSFVSDLSTGYSGNMGYPLPDDWAFDQIKEYGPSSSVSIGIDKNVSSGRYEGFNDFEKVHDNEWDQILNNGRACMLIEGPKGPYPDDKSKLKGYWAKVKRADGKFEAKYPMYDGIPVGAFYSRRDINPNRDDSKGDQIRYVYFRDVGGRLNAGYIDESSLINYPNEGKGKFVYHYFGGTEVWRDSDGKQATLIPRDLYLSEELTPETIKVHFLVTSALKCYNQDSDYYSDLLPGTKIEILESSSTGESYPHWIQCTAKMIPGSNTWESLIPGEPYGFVDLGFEMGVMPHNRSLITGISK